MEIEKGNSTKFQEPGDDIIATSDEQVAQQAFDSWVFAMEAAHARVERMRLDELKQIAARAQVAISASRAARAIRKLNEEEAK